MAGAGLAELTLFSTERDGKIPLHTRTLLSAPAGKPPAGRDRGPGHRVSTSCSFWTWPIAPVKKAGCWACLEGSHIPYCQGLNRKDPGWPIPPGPSWVLEDRRALLDPAPHLCGPRAFLILLYFELYQISLGKGAKTITLDGREVDEHIGPVFWSDKPKTLGLAEPFYRSTRHALLHLLWLDIHLLTPRSGPKKNAACQFVTCGPQLFVRPSERRFTTVCSYIFSQTLIVNRKLLYRFLAQETHSCGGWRSREALGAGRWRPCPRNRSTSGRRWANLPGKSRSTPLPSPRWRKSWGGYASGHHASSLNHLTCFTSNMLIKLSRN